MTLTRHPFSALFSKYDMSEADLAKLADDINNNGQHLPITTFDGEVLDGWNRYRACMLVNIKPAIEEFDGEDPWAFVCSVNISRRHMTAQQIAAVFLLKQNMDCNSDSVSIDTPSVRDVAKQFDVPHAAAQRLTKIAKDATPEVKQAVIDGTTSISKAAKVAELPKEQQNAALSAPKPVETLANDASTDILDGFDPIEELEKAQEEIVNLTRKIESLSSGDLSAELARQIDLYQASQARLHQEMAKIAGYDRELRRFGKMHADIRKLLGIDDDRLILSTIKSLQTA